MVARSDGMPMAAIARICTVDVRPHGDGCVDCVLRVIREVDRWMLPTFVPLLETYLEFPFDDSDNLRRALSRLLLPEPVS